MSIYKPILAILGTAIAGALVYRAITEEKESTVRKVYPADLKSCGYCICGGEGASLYKGSVSILNRDEVIVKVSEKHGNDEREEEITNILPIAVMDQIRNILYKYDILSWAELPVKQDSDPSSTQISIDLEEKSFVISSDQKLPPQAYDAFNEIIKTIDSYAGE